MNRPLLIATLVLSACLEPVDVGTHDAGSDGGVSLCVIGMDQTCNELPTMSAFAGTCSATGCVCASGFELGPTRKCRPVNACPSTPQQPGGACTTPGLTCRYGYVPVECGGRTVRCDTSTWVEVEHSDPQGSCVRDGGTCSGSAPVCLTGAVGGLCGDGATMSLCQANTWVCPQGTIPWSQCACVGTRPGCTCTAQGWSCIDSGSMNCTPGLAMSCNDGPVGADGGIGGVAGMCSSAGTCTCSPGFEINPSTGRCRRNTSSLCTGSGNSQACNEILVMASFAGQCVNGQCVCNAGFELAPSGRCQPLGAVCTDRIAMSCNDDPLDGGVGAVAGFCAVGTCGCNPGFELNPATGRCRASAAPVTCTDGVDQTCSADPAMSALAGTCVAERCQCNVGFALTSAGTCTASPGGYCVVNDGMGRCSTLSLDGGTLSGGLCGSVGIPAGCGCGGSPPMPRCLGGCAPGAGTTCVTTNCGSINCLAPLRCIGTNICDQ
jgi:hypothetical protein